MAITKNDCLLLLSEISDQGIDCKSITQQLIKEGKPSLEILKFINNYKPFDLINFYEKLRKSYNNKKSTLYINIMKEVEDPQTVLTTLNSYSLQALLFSKDLEDKQQFYNFSRIDEIYKCLNYYIQTYDLIPCIKLLQLIKADIKALETLYRIQKQDNI